MRTVFTGVLAALALIAGAAPQANGAGLPGREADPVVMTGAQTPKLIGASPYQVVAFAWDGGWRQVPVQVDERKLVDYRAVRKTTGFSPFSTMAYADPGTYAGRDDDPFVDDDDEIVTMAKDSGISAVAQADPAGVDAGTRTPIRIKDPLEPEGAAFLYLFRSSAGLDSTAGKDYVDYEFQLTAGDDYFLDYDFSGGPDNADGPPKNPEISTVTTPVYSQTMPARWMTDGLRITTGGSTGVDILDGDKSTVGDSGCGRNELTFSRGGGGFIANIDGPVRAIRSYIGANSGTFTQRDHIFYESHMESNSFVRVHSGIGNVVAAMDYSADAIGMTYRNSVNPAGVTIDGVQDSITPGKLSWEQVTGPQGSQLIIGRGRTDIPNVENTSFYLDSADPDPSESMLCSGDDHAYGASGSWVKHSGPNTDPTNPPTPPSDHVNMMDSTRYSFYGGPGETAADAERRTAQVDSPLELAIGATADRVVEKPAPEPGPETETPDGVDLSLVVRPGVATAKVGERQVLTATVRNTGGTLASQTKLCPSAKRKMVRIGRCVTIGRIPAGGRSVRFFPVRLKRMSARGSRVVKIGFRAKASTGRAIRDVVGLIPRERR